MELKNGKRNKKRKEKSDQGHEGIWKRRIAFRIKERKEIMTEKKKWIQEALSKKGSKGKLHRKLGVPEGKKIPESKIKKAEHAKGALGKEARMAETLKGLRKGKK